MLLNIRGLQIKNILSFEDVKIQLQNYNVLVGSNNSGKTNFIRILELLTSNAQLINDRRLPKMMKYNKNKPSSLSLSMSLTEVEVQILIQLLLKQNIESPIHENMRNLVLTIFWDNIYDESIRPAVISLYFGNGLLMWDTGNFRLHISYGNFPKTIENIGSGISDILSIDGNQELVDRYSTTKGYHFLDLFSQDSFKSHLVSNKKIRNFFLLDGKGIERAFEMPTVYFKDSYSDEYKEVIASIFNFLNKPLSSAFGIHLWLLVDHILKSIDIQKEFRPTVEQLAKSLFKIKKEDSDSIRIDTQ